MSMKKIPMTPSGIEPATYPACSAVPQPTALPRAPVLKLYYSINTDNKRWIQVTFDFCNYKRCSKWLPSASRHFSLRRTTAWATYACRRLLLAIYLSKQILFDNSERMITQTNIRPMSNVRPPTRLQFVVRYGLLCVWNLYFKCLLAFSVNCILQYSVSL